VKEIKVQQGLSLEGKPSREYVITLEFEDMKEIEKKL